MRDYNGFSASRRTKAAAWIREGVAAGFIDPPCVCDLCGQDRGLFDMHAEDYSEPFGPHVYRYGLCYGCHMMLHCRHRSPGAWALYLEHIHEGIFPPWRSRDFGAVQAFLRSSFPPKRPAAAFGRFDRKGLLKVLRDHFA